MRHPRAPLHIVRQQRMQPSPRRPCLVIRTQKPHRIELLPARLQRAHHLHRSAMRFRGKNRLTRLRLKNPDKFAIPHAAPVEIQQRHLIQQPLPARPRLKVNLVPSPRTAPARLIQKKLRQVHPSPRRAHFLTHVIHRGHLLQVFELRLNTGQGREAPHLPKHISQRNLQRQRP